MKNKFVAEPSASMNCSVMAHKEKEKKERKKISVGYHASCGSVVLGMLVANGDASAFGKSPHANCTAGT